MDKSTFTLTYGDCAENHKGMQKIGIMGDTGFTNRDLDRAMRWFDSHGIECEIVHLTSPVGDEAAVMIARRGVNAIVDADDFYREQDDLEKDSKAFMYGRVVNKHARWNLCFGHEYQDPDYENGKGTIVAFDDVPCLNEVRLKLPEIIGPVADNLVVEGNYYYDITKCGIGYHGDSERTKVVGVRLGATMSFCYQWFYEGEPVGEKTTLQLNHGDLYIMSDKAVGRDWKRKVIYTLRHAAGCRKFTDI